MDKMTSNTSLTAYVMQKILRYDALDKNHTEAQCKVTFSFKLELKQKDKEFFICHIQL